MKEERKRIIKMVEEGKLNAEEALTLLDELEKSTKTMEQKQEELIGELSTVVQTEEANKKDSNQYKFQSAKDKIFEFVDIALKKIKEVDLDFNFGSYVEISHVYFQSEVDLKELSIDIANGKVKLIPWDQKDVRIECQAKVHRVETQEEARKKFLDDVIFTIEGDKLRFSAQQKMMKVDAEVYVPHSLYDRVRVRMFNGTIASEKITAKECMVKTANGKINIEGMESGRVEAETANGNITFKNTMIDHIEAETINGAIKVDGEIKRAELQSFNGNITCHTTALDCREIEANATTGSIEIHYPEQPVQGLLKSNLGGINIDLTQMTVMEEKNEIVQKLLRFASLTNHEKPLKLSAETKTGSVSINRK